jgi:hypothetical protein
MSDELTVISAVPFTAVRKLVRGAIEESVPVDLTAAVMSDGTGRLYVLGVMSEPIRLHFDVEVMRRLVEAFDFERSGGRK